MEPLVVTGSRPIGLVNITYRLSTPERDAVHPQKGSITISMLSLEN